MTSSKRIFWTQEERAAVAHKMAHLLTTSPSMTKLAAVKEAQVALPEDRRREILAWSVVEPTLLPLLLNALATANQPPAAPASTSEPTPTAEQLPPEQSSEQAVADLPVDNSFEEATPADLTSIENNRFQEVEESLPSASHEADLSTNAGQEPLDPAPADIGVTTPWPPEEVLQEEAPLDYKEEHAPVNQVETPAPETARYTPEVRVPAISAVDIEAAILVALSSPAVKESLTRLFTNSLAQAVLRVESNEQAQELEAPRIVDNKVLLAGFPKNQVKALESVLSKDFEVRTWQNNQGAPVLNTLGAMCAITVVPEEMPEEFDEFLKPLGTKVIRFQGSSQRLLVQVVEAFSS